MTRNPGIRVSARETARLHRRSRNGPAAGRSASLDRAPHRTVRGLRGPDRHRHRTAGRSSGSHHPVSGAVLLAASAEIAVKNRPGVGMRVAQPETATSNRPPLDQSANQIARFRHQSTSSRPPSHYRPVSAYNGQEVPIIASVDQFNMVHPDDREMVRQHVAQTLAGEDIPPLGGCPSIGSCWQCGSDSGLRIL